MVISLTARANPSAVTHSWTKKGRRVPTAVDCRPTESCPDCTPGARSSNSRTRNAATGTSTSGDREQRGLRQGLRPDQQGTFDCVGHNGIGKGSVKTANLVVKFFGLRPYECVARKELPIDSAKLYLDTLRVQTDLTFGQIEAIESTSLVQTAEIHTLMVNLSAHKLDEEALKQNQGLVQFYTGLPNIEVLQAVFDLAKGSVSHTPLNCLSQFEEMMVLFLRLRLNAQMLDLAYRGQAQLAPWEVERTRKIANARIHVERVIGLVRNKYPILKATQSFDMLLLRDEDLTVLDQTVFLCAALTNLCDSVVPSD
ncbi:uncharacterized protein ISCGN_003433 [Ixodes scapularis]